VLVHTTHNTLSFGRSADHGAPLLQREEIDGAPAGTFLSFSFSVFCFFFGFAFAGRDSRATTGCDPVSRRAKCHIGPCKKRLARTETTV
jgi:hypothetical protein